MSPELTPPRTVGGRKFAHPEQRLSPANAAAPLLGERPLHPQANVAARLAGVIPSGRNFAHSKMVNIAWGRRGIRTPLVLCVKSQYAALVFVGKINSANRLVSHIVSKR